MTTTYPASRRQRTFVGGFPEVSAVPSGLLSVMGESVEGVKATSVNSSIAASMLKRPSRSATVSRATLCSNMRKKIRLRSSASSASSNRPPVVSASFLSSALSAASDRATVCTATLADCNAGTTSLRMALRARALSVAPPATSTTPSVSRSSARLGAASPGSLSDARQSAVASSSTRCMLVN